MSCTDFLFPVTDTVLVNFDSWIIPAHIRFCVVDATKGQSGLRAVDKRTSVQRRFGIRVYPNPAKVVYHCKKVFPPLPFPPANIRIIRMQMPSEKFAATSTTGALASSNINRLKPFLQEIDHVSSMKNINECKQVLIDQLSDTVIDG